MTTFLNFWVTSDSDPMKELMPKVDNPIFIPMVGDTISKDLFENYIVTERKIKFPNDESESYHIHIITEKIKL